MAPAAAGVTATAAPTPEEPPDAARGLLLYGEHCADCHGSSGIGDGPLASELPVRPRSFTDLASIRGTSLADAYAVVTHGRLDRGMPPWSEGLTAQDRWDVVVGAWTYGLTPDRLARGRAVWHARCAECHPVGGERGPNLPDVSDWPPADVLTRSAEELWQSMRVAAPVHRWIGEDDASADSGSLHSATDLDTEPSDVDEEGLRLAIDYGRSLTYEAFALDGLAPGLQLSGMVRNGTSGGAPTGATVVVATPYFGPVPGIPVTATVAADGGFRFSDLVGGAAARYELSAEYAGTAFVHPDPVTVMPDGSPIDVYLEVYETEAGLPVRMAGGHIIVDPLPDSGVVGVTEVWLVDNDTDRASVPGPGGGLRFTLPTGARALAMPDERTRDAARLEGSTVVDNAPVPPGRRQIVLRYEVPYRGRSLTLDRVLDQPVDRLQVVVTTPGADIDSPVLGGPSPMEIEGRSVMVSEAVSVPVGAALVARVGGLPESRPPTGALRDAVTAIPPSPLPSQAPVLFGVALALAGAGLVLAYPSMGARRGRRGGVADAYGRLVEELAALDDSQAEDPLPPEIYARKRADLMRRAIDALRTMEAIDP